MKIKEDQSRRGDRRADAGFPLLNRATSDDFNQGRILAIKLAESWSDAVQMTGEGFTEATEGWRLKLRSMMAARRISPIQAYYRIEAALRDKGMLQRSVLMMIRAATFDLISSDLADDELL